MVKTYQFTINGIIGIGSVSIKNNIYYLEYILHTDELYYYNDYFYKFELKNIKDNLEFLIQNRLKPLYAIMKEEIPYV